MSTRPLTSPNAARNVLTHTTDRAFNSERHSLEGLWRIAPPSGLDFHPDPVGGKRYEPRSPLL
jgi:hypothetical protein